MEITYNKSGNSKPGNSSLFKGIDLINQRDYKSALQYLEQASKRDNECAQLLTASIYYMGFDVDRNVKKAMLLFKRVATVWKNRVGQYYVGMMYRDGDDGIRQCTESAIHWLTLSANGGWNDAQVNLGLIYHRGVYAKKDHTKALYWYKRSLQSKASQDLYLFGNKEFKIVNDSKQVFLYRLSEAINKKNGSPSPLHTAKSYDKRFLTKQNFYKTHFWYSMCEEQQNHVLVRSLVGELYLFGQGRLKKDYVKAEIWLEKAAKSGNANAQFFMGYLYQCKQNLNGAFLWYSRASKNGKVEAIFKMAEFYYCGMGVEKDYIKAKGYCETILECADHGRSYNMLGDIHASGVEGVVQRDYKKAMRYYMEAVKVGCGDGSAGIGLIYECGYGVKKNNKRAYQWYLKAATENSGRGQLLLGRMYMKGLVVEKNYDLAIQYLQKSLANGLLEAEGYIQQAISFRTKCY
ncbi:hypothetical protein INT47_003077 [Mucor saturninus]|uniref:Uncharacterized protein n=1 Tax=Mucor saturninus TaxID=64648 RepID=A0A8H7V0W4_9FUNG|nr:hypothetical protein INT47_003077 [Mucor saturninus]